MLYRKVLVTIDGSEFSLAALEHLARVQAAEVVVFQVAESTPFLIARQTGLMTDVPADLAKEIAERERRAVGVSLASAQERLRRLGIENISTGKGEGKPGEAIVEFAQREGCDLVVMSTHGRTGVRRAMLGSVADYVVHNLSAAAVLLVRPEGETA